MSNTATVEVNAPAGVHQQCPRCQGAIAHENVTHGAFRHVHARPKPYKSRTVHVYCDFCEETFHSLEKVYV